MARSPLSLAAAAAGLLAATHLASAGVLVAGEKEVDFATQIRPLLEAYCYECHGPDEDAREAELRLDRREGAFKDLGGYANIVPGDPEDSELYLRVAAEISEERMPPPEAGTILTEDEIETIRIWILEGAEWPQED